MKALLDTCVLAELRRPEGHPAVKSAVAEVPMRTSTSAS